MPSSACDSVSGDSPGALNAPREQPAPMLPFLMWNASRVLPTLFHEWLPAGSCRSTLTWSPARMPELHSSSGVISIVTVWPTSAAPAPLETPLGPAPPSVR